MKRIGLLCIVLTFIFSTQSLAQVSVGDKGSLSGRVFSDYYWMAQHHDKDIEGKNGFWFRRIYFTYEREFSKGFSSRLRLEMNSSGDFQSDPEMVPNVKDAYLKYEKGEHQILAGISSTPTWGLVEDVWGYRPVEKSAQDVYDYGSSRDFGIAFKGKVGKENKVNYHFFVGNGNSNKPEVNKGKKFMLSLGYELTDHFVIEGYADWNDAADDPNSQDYYTTQAFAGYQSENLNFGALYSYQVRDNRVGDDIKLDLVSVFTNFRFNEKVKGYLRTDHLFDSYIGGANNSYLPFAMGVESTLIVGGVDILLEDHIHLMPNVETIVYGENSIGQTPDTDIIPRLTLFYKF